MGFVLPHPTAYAVGLVVADGSPLSHLLIGGREVLDRLAETAIFPALPLARPPTQADVTMDLVVQGADFVVKSSKQMACGV